jgi:hypothetical protein
MNLFDSVHNYSDLPSDLTVFQMIMSSSPAEILCMPKNRARQGATFRSRRDTPEPKNPERLPDREGGNWSLGHVHVHVLCKSGMSGFSLVLV